MNYYHREHRERLEKALDHGRELFVYHASQRQTSIRFYFIAMALFIPVYTSAFSDAWSTANPSLFAGVLGIAGAILSAWFWVLDRRNARLVQTAEDLLKRVEDQLRRNTGILEYRTIEATEKAPYWQRYHFVMPHIFLLFIVLLLAGSWMSLSPPSRWVSTIREIEALPFLALTFAVAWLALFLRLQQDVDDRTASPEAPLDPHSARPSKDVNNGKPASTKLTLTLLCWVALLYVLLLMCFTLFEVPQERADIDLRELSKQIEATHKAVKVVDDKLPSVVPNVGATTSANARAASLRLSQIIASTLILLAVLFFMTWQLADKNSPAKMTSGISGLLSLVLAFVVFLVGDGVLLPLFQIPPTQRQFTLVLQNGIEIREAGDAQLSFSIPFEEAGCRPPGVASASNWKGVTPQPQYRGFLRSLGRGLRSCAEGGAAVIVETVGFASSSQFKDCGQDSESLNRQAANTRAERVAQLIRDEAGPSVVVYARPWPDLLSMQAAQFRDRQDDGNYSLSRGTLNRRVQVVLHEVADCTIQPEQSTLKP